MNIWKSIIFSPGMAVFVMFLIVFMGFAVFSIVGKSVTVARERRGAEAEAIALKAKEDELSSKLAALRTPDGQEAVLREQFPVVKPGERVIVITDEKPESAQAKMMTANVESSGSGFLQFFKNLFQ